jgi:hypothetical protein
MYFCRLVSPPYWREQTQVNSAGCLVKLNPNLFGFHMYWHSVSQVIKFSQKFFLQFAKSFFAFVTKSLYFSAVVACALLPIPHILFGNCYGVPGADSNQVSDKDSLQKL